MPDARVLLFGVEGRYVDPIACLVVHHACREVELAFLIGGADADAPTDASEQTQVVARVYAKLSDLGARFPAYRAASSVRLLPRTFRLDDRTSLLRGIRLLDVSSAPKPLTMELVAEALQYGAPQVCHLEWLERLSPGVDARIGGSPYRYVDLTTLEKTAALGRSYAARADALLGVAVATVLLAVLALASHWYASFAFVNSILTAVGVVASFAGLYLAVGGRMRRPRTIR